MQWVPCPLLHLTLHSWLEVCFREGRAHTAFFSHRWLAERMGRGPGYLANVIAGRRSIADEAVEQLCDALRLSGARRAHVTDLAQLSRLGERNIRRRRRLLKRVAARHRQGGGRRLDASWYAYLSEWFFVAIREMVGLPGFRPDPSWIRRRLVAPVGLHAIRDCLTVLENLELVHIDGERVTRGTPRDEAVSFGHEARSAAVGAFHVEMLRLAARSIDEVDPTARHLNAKTITVHRDQIPLLKARINALLDELRDAPPEDAPDAVYQLQVALFPLAFADDAEGAR